MGFFHHVRSAIRSILGGARGARGFHHPDLARIALPSPLSECLLFFFVHAFVISPTCVPLSLPNNLRVQSYLK